MGYELSKNESIAENIRRMWSQELSVAIETLENSGNEPDKAIHDVRKSIKKIRAVLRLVKHDMGKEMFGKENIRYRNIGHLLSHVRDATVMIKTLYKLRETNRRVIPRVAYTNAQKKLSARQVEISKHFFEDNQSIAAVLTALREAQQQQPQVSVSKESFSVFAVNIHQIYKRGKKAYAHASKQPSIDSFHELRKEVKVLWYHTRILKPAWPSIMESYATELGVLSELLGNDHDMGVLYEEIKSGRLSFGRKATASTILKLIESYRENLQQQLYPMARRVFAERAKDYTSRLKVYWTIWCKENMLEQTV